MKATTERVETTLFLLVSVDGKITSGASDLLVVMAPLLVGGRDTSTLVDAPPS